MTATEVAYLAEPPGTGGVGEGTMGTVSVVEIVPNKALAQLAFNAVVNTNAKVYRFIALG